MLLRFFLALWISFIVTIATVIFVLVTLELEPPEEEMLFELARLSAKDAYEAGGVEAVYPLFADGSLFGDGILVWAAPAGHADCTELTQFATDAHGRCLMLVDENWVADDKAFPWFIPLGVGFAISLFFALGLTGYMAVPLRVLRENILGLADGELDRRVGRRMHRFGPEMKALGEAFDSTASQLQAYSDSREQLFHDVSHEIRSPLARLKAAIELMRRDPERVDVLMGRMEDDIGRMNHLLGQILTLARFEHQSADTLEMQRGDFLDVLDPILEDARFEGRGKDLTITYRGPQHQPLTMEPELLHRVFENILRNALKHSPDQGEIRVQVIPADGKVNITVEDNGEGVPEADLELLFRPYKRGSQSGVGLGLAIAQRAVSLHHGEISAHLKESGGLAVRVSLPV